MDERNSLGKEKTVVTAADVTEDTYSFRGTAASSQLIFSTRIDVLKRPISFGLHVTRTRKCEYPGIVTMVTGALVSA